MGNMDVMCRIYDKNGVEQDTAWLDTYFGPQVEHHKEPVDQCYRLVALRESESAYQQVTFLDASGNGMPGVEAVYRLVYGGQTQKLVTPNTGVVAFQQPAEASYNVPSEEGPMVAFAQGNDAAMYIGNVNVKGTSGRHLDVVYQWGTTDLYDDPGTTPPPTEPVPPTKPGQVEVIDFQGKASTWAWLESVFGPDVEIEARGDWECYRLLAKTGPSSITTTVRDSSDAPVPGMGVACDWPDGVANGVTDGAGAWGFAMGKGSYYHPENGEHGCHNIWLTTAESDRVCNLGMLGGTEHDHLEPWFRPRTNQGKQQDMDCESLLRFIMQTIQNYLGE